MSNRWQVVLGVVALVGVLIVAGTTVAVAQGPWWTPPQDDGGWTPPWGGMMAPHWGYSPMMGPGWGQGAMMGFGWGHGPMMGAGWGMHGAGLIQVAADVLGMEPADLISELQAGQSIADLADERGIEPQTIIDAFLAKHQAALQQAVRTGWLTQEQANLMLDHMAEEVAEHISEPGLGEHGPDEDCPMFDTGQSSGWGRRGSRAFMMGR